MRQWDVAQLSYKTAINEGGVEHRRALQRKEKKGRERAGNRMDKRKEEEEEEEEEGAGRGGGGGGHGEAPVPF